MMIKWIAHWFKHTAGTDAGGAPVAAVLEQPGGAAARAPAQLCDDLHTDFYRWLAGRPFGDEARGEGRDEGQGAGDAAPAPTEKLFLDELARLVAAPQSGADLVPRVPAVIPQLLRSLRDDSVAVTELSRQLAQDVVLVAEAIREANSPYYRSSRPVRTIDAAIMLLGQNGMRMLLARVAFRPIIQNQSGRFAAAIAPQVWRQSELCALAASMLAQSPGMRADPFEAYLAGLLHHVGLIVALRLVDQMHAGAAMPCSSQFSAALPPLARLLSARIAELWEFPVTVSMAIEQAGQADSPDLANVLALAERVAILRVLVDAGALAPTDPRVVQGLGPIGAACFEKLRHEED